MKYRMKSWRWGLYVEKKGKRWQRADGTLWKYPPPEDLTNQKPGWPQWEEYIEEIHGKHMENKK